MFYSVILAAAYSVLLVGVLCCIITFVFKRKNLLANFAIAAILSLVIALSYFLVEQAKWNDKEAILEEKIRSQEIVLEEYGYCS